LGAENHHFLPAIIDASIRHHRFTAGDHFLRPHAIALPLKLADDDSGLFVKFAGLETVARYENNILGRQIYSSFMKQRDICFHSYVQRRRITKNVEELILMDLEMRVLVLSLLCTKYNIFER